MLEGNELEGMIGTAGKYVVDVDAEGTVKAALIYNIEGVEVSINVTVTMLALIEKALLSALEHSTPV